MAAVMLPHKGRRDVHKGGPRASVKTVGTDLRQIIIFFTDFSHM